MKLKPSVKVTIEVAKKMHRLSLIPSPWKGRYWLRYRPGLPEKGGEYD
jgi:hypothetical protein